MAPLTGMLDMQSSWVRSMYIRSTPGHSGTRSGIPCNSRRLDRRLVRKDRGTYTSTTLNMTRSHMSGPADNIQFRKYVMRGSILLLVRRGPHNIGSHTAGEL